MIPSLYIQDTFHANTRLTLVAGVRWEPEYYPHDFFNRGTTFDYAAFLANKTSTVYPNAPAGTFFYGDPGVSNAFTRSSTWQFSPNVGLSFDPTGTGKTVLRAGFELAYDEVNFFNAQRNEQNPPYATASNPNTTGQICFSQPWLMGGSGFGCATGGRRGHEPVSDAAASHAGDGGLPGAEPVYCDASAVPPFEHGAVDGECAA